MKNIKKAYSIIFLFVIVSCQSQERNYLTLAEFNNILIDGVKWQDIDNTKGDLSKMKILFGNNLNYKTADEPNSSIGFWDKGFYFDFEDLDESGEYQLINFSIDNSNSTISIKGISITLGDDFSKLGNIKINSYKDGTIGAIYILEGSDSDGLFIKCNPSTNKITEIEYILFN